MYEPPLTNQTSTTLNHSVSAVPAYNKNNNHFTNCNVNHFQNNFHFKNMSNLVCDTSNCDNNCYQNNSVSIQATNNDNYSITNNNYNNNINNINNNYSVPNNNNNNNAFNDNDTSINNTNNVNMILNQLSHGGYGAVHFSSQAASRNRYNPLCVTNDYDHSTYNDDKTNGNYDYNNSNNYYIQDEYCQQQQQQQYFQCSSCSSCNSCCGCGCGGCAYVQQ